jgi:hypothetical protein
MWTLNHFICYITNCESCVVEINFTSCFSVPVWLICRKFCLYFITCNQTGLWATCISFEPLVYHTEKILVNSFFMNGLNIMNLLHRNRVPKHLYHPINACLWHTNLWRISYAAPIYGKFGHPWSINMKVGCIEAACYYNFVRFCMCNTDLFHLSGIEGCLVHSLVLFRNFVKKKQEWKIRYGVIPLLTTFLIL